VVLVDHDESRETRKLHSEALETACVLPMQLVASLAELHVQVLDHSWNHTLGDCSDSLALEP
jgi:hypothetical protein